MTWVSPTGDQNSQWTNPELARDGDLGTEATQETNNKSFELTISAITCDKVRVHAAKQAGGATTLEIEVYYGGDWHSIHNGEVVEDDWEEIAIGSEQTVTAARITMRTAINSEVHEFEFNSLGAAVVAGGRPPSSIRPKTRYRHTLRL